MIPVFLSVLLLSVSLAGSEHPFCFFILDCGVYSNGCERITGFSWSTISKYKVSCDFSGYVKKITKSIENYSNDGCTDGSFMSNEYVYALTKASDATDKSACI